MDAVQKWQETLKRSQSDLNGAFNAKEVALLQLTMVNVFTSLHFNRIAIT